MQMPKGENELVSIHASVKDATPILSNSFSSVKFQSTHL